MMRTKTHTELRLECLRMAMALATAKCIGANDIQNRAEDFYRWINEEPQPLASPAQRTALRDHYRNTDHGRSG